MVASLFLIVISIVVVGIVGRSIFVVPLLFVADRNVVNVLGCYCGRCLGFFSFSDLLFCILVIEISCLLGCLVLGLLFCCSYGNKLVIIVSTIVFPISIITIALFTILKLIDFSTSFDNVFARFLPFS